MTKAPPLPVAKKPKLGGFDNILGEAQSAPEENTSTSVDSASYEAETRQKRRVAKKKSSEFDRLKTVARVGFEVPRDLRKRMLNYISERKSTAAIGDAYSERRMLIEAVTQFLDREEPKL